MTDRTVRVRLDLDNSGAHRGAAQSERDFRQIAQAAVAAGAEQQNAFQRAAAASTSAMERTAAVARTSGRATQESVQATSASLFRLAATAEELPATFSSAASVSSRALGEVATAASAAAARTTGGLADISAAALGTSQALARTSAVTVNLSTAAAEAMGRLGGAAGAAFGEVTAAAAPAAAATARVGAVAAEIPAALRSAAAAQAALLAQVTAAGTRSSLAIGQTSSALTAANLAATRGVEQLSLASRLALSQAAAAAGVVTAEVAAAQATLFGRAGLAASGWAATVRAQSASAATALVTAGESGEKTFKAMRTGGLLMLGIFAAMSYEAAKFEKAMSGVGAVADATAGQMVQLRAAALEAGRATSFTASQAADAEAELARAGVSVADILGGALRGALSLAAAGQLSLSEAATVAAQSMNTFGLRGKDVAHVADVLAAGANKSAADVHGLGEAMRMGGLLAHQTGLRFEDTVGTLAAFADHALIGSDAGTSLKTMLQRLTPQSTEAANMMDQLGFSAYDAQGQFVGLTELARRMQRSFSDLTPEARNSAMGVIFGSDAVRAATILYEQGAKGIDTYRSAVDDSGAAARTAGTQLDNLAGDLEALRGSLEVALIESGTKANEVIRDMVQWLTRLVNAYSELPGWAQETAAGVLAIGGALTVMAAGLLLVLPRIAAFQTSVATLSATMPGLAAAATTSARFLTGPWGLAIAGGIAALTIFGAQHKTATTSVEGLTEAVKADSGAIGDNSRQYVINSLQKSGAMAAAKKLGIDMKDLTDATLGHEDALTRVNAAMDQFTKLPMDQMGTKIKGAFGEGKEGFASWTSAMDLVHGSIGDVSKGLDDAKAAYVLEGEAAGGAASSTAKFGSTTEKTADQVHDTRTELEKFTDKLDQLNGVNISAMQANIAVQSSFADLTKAAKEGGTSLDITTEKGRAVKSALLDAAEAAQKHAEAVAKQTGSTEQANVVLAQDVEALKRVMTQAGFNEEQINSLIGTYARLPPVAETKVTAPGVLQTIADMERARRAVENVPPGKTVTMQALTGEAEKELKALGYSVEHLPSGSVKVTVPTNDAMNQTAAIQASINNLKGKTIAVHINAGMILPENREANGGIVGYANGGITAAANGLDTRQAGFASSAILWAEAGREAYIPMDPAKRGRSTALLGQVASEFGLQLLPTARDLIPTRGLSAPSSTATASGGDRITNITLNGAGQSREEQLADLARRLAFVDVGG